MSKPVDRFFRTAFNPWDNAEAVRVESGEQANSHKSSLASCRHCAEAALIRNDIAINADRILPGAFSDCSWGCPPEHLRSPSCCGPPDPECERGPETLASSEQESSRTRRLLGWWCGCVGGWTVHVDVVVVSGSVEWVGSLPWPSEVVWSGDAAASLLPLPS